ncbi:hypothetical protein [Amycolatopsis taiwanensis]|uniref:hypothetical protein n=1 Tax=Amycolatopsis taiwanensis TaxID=342230 RepID=UPI0004B54ADF|nr:hypothetical protein [Amycolatopsis taiwanensis]
MWTETFLTTCVDPQVSLFVAQTAGGADNAVLVIHGGPDWDHSYLREPLGELAGRHFCCCTAGRT